MFYTFAVFSQLPSNFILVVSSTSWCGLTCKENLLFLLIYLYHGITYINYKINKITISQEALWMYSIQDTKW